MNDTHTQVENLRSLYGHDPAGDRPNCDFCRAAAGLAPSHAGGDFVWPAGDCRGWLLSDPADLGAPKPRPCREHRHLVPKPAPRNPWAKPFSWVRYAPTEIVRGQLPLFEICYRLRMGSQVMQVNVYREESRSAIAKRLRDSRRVMREGRMP